MKALEAGGLEACMYITDNLVAPENPEDGRKTIGMH